MKFLGYQKRWLRDRSRLRLCNKARHIGYSFVVSFDHAAEAIGLDPLAGSYEPQLGVDQLFVSTGQTQAIELLQTALLHVRGFEQALGRKLIDGKPSQELIKLTNGCAIRALPGGNATAIRSWSGSVFLDEFAFIPDAEECYKAAYFVASPTIAHPDRFRLSIVSTPNGPSGLFFELAETERGEEYSKHETDVWSAIADGFPLDPEEERAKRDKDPTTYAQEMECCFVSQDTQFIKAEVYDAALVDIADQPTAHSMTFAGYDVGRRRDLSAAVEAFLDWQNVLHVTDVESKRDMPWAAQKEWTLKIAERSSRMAVDETGIGNQLAEEVAIAAGGSVVKFNFGVPKERVELFDTLAWRFENGMIRIPRRFHALRRAVLSIEKRTTKTGQVQYVARRKGSGHADEAMALGLCCYAAKRPMPTFEVESYNPRRSVGLRDAMGLGSSLSLRWAR